MDEGDTSDRYRSRRGLAPGRLTAGGARMLPLLPLLLLAARSPRRRLGKMRKGESSGEERHADSRSMSNPCNAAMSTPCNAADMPPRDMQQQPAVYAVPSHLSPRALTFSFHGT